MTDTNQTSMTKKRRAVWNKTKGHCWYCGWELPNRWHVDHVEPVLRYNSSPYYGEGTPVMSKPELHTVENMVPACPQCNLWKSSSSIEQFRKRIEGVVDVIRHYSVKFRNAERFNLVEQHNEPVVFYFEKEGLSNDQ